MGKGMSEEVVHSIDFAFQFVQSNRPDSDVTPPARYPGETVQPLLSRAVRVYLRPESQVVTSGFDKTVRLKLIEVIRWCVAAHKRRGAVAAAHKNPVTVFVIEVEWTKEMIEPVL
jgi:hypothetical protein